VVAAALFVLLAGGMLDHFLIHKPGVAVGFLILVGGLEATYLGGTHAGIFRGIKAAGERPDVRSPAIADVLE